MSHVKIDSVSYRARGIQNNPQLEFAERPLPEQRRVYRRGCLIGIYGVIAYSVA